MFMLPEKIFEKPYNEISSNAKIIFLIHLQDLANEGRYEDLGNCKKYYKQPQRTSIDEIMEMTKLDFSEVYEALVELNRVGLCGGDDFTCH